MPDATQTPEESPQNAANWLPVAAAAAAFGISTKTLRKRMARAEVRFRRVVLARGGAAFEVEMETEMERSKPLSKPNAALSDFTLESGALEVEMESSKPMPKSSKPKGEMESGLEVELLRDALARERELNARFLTMIEGHARAEAELRATIREMAKAQPKALTAGNEPARNGQSREQNDGAGNYGPDASNGARIEREREKPLSYGDIADALEAQLNGS